jgi:NAD(P)-dependent dehydrogenase (short-subunit alcohol dehydrogenase family)
VLVTDVNDTLGNEAAEEIRAGGGEADFLHVDVSDKEQVQAMVEAAASKWGRVDVLVNNAWGGGGLGRVESKTDEQLAHGFGVGFYGPFWAMRAAFPHMKAAGYGRVINLCSLNGVNAHMGSLEYNAAKEALRTLTRTAAREWAPTGVVVNAVCPGAKTAAARALEVSMPDLIKGAEASNPMGRMGDPDEDIAPVILFLASDDVRYMTGNTLFVDGGGHINGVSWAPPLPD